MFLLISTSLFLLIVTSAIKVDNTVYCSNGRPALWAFNISTFRFSAHCSIPGKVCHEKQGKCSKEHLCCPQTLKMSSKRQLYDPATNIKFVRIGNDYNNSYRLYELNLTSNNQITFDHYARWVFFDETLRDLFEMPNARFWYSVINCLQNYGIVYAFVPLNATSVTSNISAMTVLTRKTNSLDDLYVCYMATRKEHRRRGLGTRILQQIVRRALDERRNGIKHITLHVNTLNRPALELYEKCGWRCYQYLPTYLDPDPHHATNHAYALRLDLNIVKNVTGLCRDSNAINAKLLDNKQSIEICQRVPVQLQQ